MKERKFENGIEVYESEYDHDVHCFKVYEGNYLGTVYPESVQDTNASLKDWMQVLIQSAMVGKTDQGMLACLTDREWAKKNSKNTKR